MSDDVDETLLDVIRSEGPEWDILGVDVVDETDDGTLFLLVIRRRVGESGNLILSERYFRYDPSEPDGATYLSNGIERRITGSLGAALRVLYAATTNGDVDPDSPMLMDSRGDGLDYSPEELVEPLGDLLDDESDEVDFVDERPVDDEPEEVDRDGWVRCKRCDDVIPEEEALLFSSGPPLGEVWVHEGGCPEEEEVDS